MTTPNEDDFWEIAEPLLSRPGVTRSTMMGYPCLRLNGDFFASWDPHHRQLVIKLDRPAVTEMIETGQAEPFAPGGRRFREWAALPAEHRPRWAAAIDYAFGHALRRKK
jgi:hypothetical protein